MSHDTHHGHSTENQTIISFKNSFWLVLIIALLFIGALNFVQSESGAEGEGHEGTKTEANYEKGRRGAASGETEKTGKEAPKGEEKTVEAPGERQASKPTENAKPAESEHK